MALAQPTTRHETAESCTLLTPANLRCVTLRRYSVEEYLAMERKAEERHIYLDGRIFQMAGESLAHSDICMSLARIFGTQLRGKSCRPLSPNMKVRSGPYEEGQKSRKGFFSYPNLSIVCGAPQFHDKFKDVLTNPTVIIEVLSESTGNFDRFEKLLRYRQHLDSLTDYILVWQDRPVIEHFARQENGIWTHTAYLGLESSLFLASVECTLPLREIYDRVEFPQLEAEAAADEAAEVTESAQETQT